MNWISWCITIIPVIAIVGLGIYSRKYVRGVADFLAAGRVAGRYVISVGDLEAGLGVITLVALVEEKYQCGYALGFWGNIMVPLSVVISLTGYCVYRFRETRSLSIGQFLEVRYSRKFRIFAASLRTISEMLANAIGPAVAARFFIYFLGLPHVLKFCGIEVSTFALLLFVVLVMAMLVILPGGRISLIITDCFQGLLSYPIFVIFTIYILTKFSWGLEISPVMLDRVPGENFLNPFDVEQLRDFNLFALFVAIFASILNRASWIGNDTSGSARSPHEQKMAGIIGAWRNGFSVVMCLLVSVAVITIMSHGNFSSEAKKIRVELSNQVADEVITDGNMRKKVIDKVNAIPEIKHVIGVDKPLSRENNPDTVYFKTVKDTLNEGENGNALFQKFRTLYFQMMMALTMKNIFPAVLMGIFCLLMVMLMLSTDASRIFNASATLIQDVVMPLRKTPFTKEQHLKWLRGCSVGVGIFFFIVSLFFTNLDYINMFLTITTSIWLGGAGPVMIFGLYSRFGTTAGAWASLLCGSGIAIFGMIFQRNWADYLYPWIEQLNMVKPLDTLLRAVSAPFSPYIVWAMDPVKYPINSREIYFFSMLAGILAYIIISWLTCKEPFNLDRMLHRGKYSIGGEHEKVVHSKLRHLYNTLIGIDAEYTRGDKIIAWSVFVYSMVYQFLFAFVGVLIWNWFSPLSPQWWSGYFLVTNLIVSAAVGVVSTVWFMIGGIMDMGKMFRDLEARKDNPLDDGWVEGHVSAADQALVARVEHKK
jgi:Na+/proline symporter